MTTKGKAFRKRQWWLTGNDELAANDRKVEVWIGNKHSIPKNLFNDLESLLNSGSAKDVPHEQNTQRRASPLKTHGKMPGARGH